MPHIPQHRRVMKSILDRLIDDDPGSADPATREPSQELRDLKQSVRRDLENLLNTRWSLLPPIDGIPELDQSLMNYGIVDCTAANLGVPAEREKYCQHIAAVIRRYEPRFKSVKVQLLRNRDPGDRTLLFRIDAVLYAEPAPEPVVFDSRLEPASSTFEVAGAAL